ncbi:hypothetical protein ACFPIJ_42765 [Dactylosporangium cerinum]|uniref:Alpha/beta hydrolase n=1 Tax=Dactylosporangium cerinum TaxID=1434730 RepID=A0ABV9W9C1_9ACTN
MPIVFIHGVATRDSAPDQTVVDLMRRYLSDVVSPGREVDVHYVYWGDVGARFAWGGASRPRTRLAGQGGDDAPSPASRAVLAADLGPALPGLPAPAAAPPVPSRLVPSGPAPAPPFSLRTLPADALSDFLASVLTADGVRDAAVIIAADDAAHDQALTAALTAAGGLDEEWDLVGQAIDRRLDAGPLAGMGAGDRWTRLRDRVGEYLARGNDATGYAITTVLAETRPRLNDLATTFVGDVFEYIDRRGTVAEVGEIPRRLLTALRQASGTGEPVVVISHSMGGQIVYDAVTTFLPQLPGNQDLRVDYWCATASQVGLFEEMKQFLASDPSHRSGVPVPFPDRKYLGGWWNVWDHNDFLSYTVRGIIDGVDDEPFDSGMSLVSAHSGYLVRPSFYRRLASKLAAAAEQGWGR